MSNFSQNAIAVLERRYLSRNEDGQIIEDISGLFARVARAVAAAESAFGGDPAMYEQAFYDAMINREFMPNSPTLMNAGRPLGQLSACFVLPVPDSMEGIFDAVKSAALIHKSGGGTGFSFSRLRQSGAAVRSTGGVASGPVSFMRVFNAATEAVKQGGTRRGANMGILRVDHPDIEHFIRAKADNLDITNFNISIGITDAFMDALTNNADYDMIDPITGSIAGERSARDVFDTIVEGAWSNGEPGMIFLDRMNASNPVPALGQIEATNPCGEQPLLPYESCNLGSINLTGMISSGAVDYAKLANTVALAVRFLDNVIEINQYPLPQIAEMTKKTRKIGLGVMGFADMLFTLNIPYDSAEAVALAESIMSFITTCARETSRQLAKVRGAFPTYLDSVYAADAQPPRNATVTTIAPTGTISMICGVSSGIEPLFALAYMRRVMDNTELPEVNAAFEAAIRLSCGQADEILRAVAKVGSCAHVDGVPDDIRRAFVTAHDISPKAHVDMQAAFQRHTDNAVSKTVNFTGDATREQVEDTFLSAYASNLKGITIYRDGSRQNQVLNISESAAKTPDAESQTAIRPRPRPEITMGITEKVKIGCGNLYVTVNYDEHGVCEVFTNLGRAGGCPSQSEATSRLTSLALRSGIDVHALIEQLRGIRCHSTLRQRDSGIKVLSCPDAIGQVLAKVAKMRQISRPAAESHAAPCPECGASLTHEGGCTTCMSCGYSKCN